VGGISEAIMDLMRKAVEEQKKRKPEYNEAVS
jgi:hypothetical protein